MKRLNKILELFRSKVDSGDRKLVKNLCGLLSHYAGEFGHNEGAEDTLHRLLSELNCYREYLGKELRTWATGNSKPTVVFNWTPNDVARLLSEKEGLQGVILELAGQIAMERATYHNVSSEAAKEATSELVTNLCKRYNVEPFSHGDLNQVKE